MGKTVIKEELFPEIIKQYNANGKTAVYDFLRSEYGIKHPYFVMNRIRECGKYTYDADADQFVESEMETADGVFMDLEELCATSAINLKSSYETAVRNERTAAMEKLVHEFVSDRLLTLSRYITLDTSTRTILIDQTSLSADGYQMVTH